MKRKVGFYCKKVHPSNGGFEIKIPSFNTYAVVYQTDAGWYWYGKCYYTKTQANREAKYLLSLGAMNVCITKQALETEEMLIGQLSTTKKTARKVARRKVAKKKIAKKKAKKKAVRKTLSKTQTKGYLFEETM